VIAKLRELVMFDLSPAQRSEAAELPDGGKHLEVQELGLGYSAGRGPVYRAKFICGM
jgi:hypothetical protein